MASVELYESRTFSLAGTVVRGQRVFLVNATTPQTALLDPIIPAYGTGFEFTPGKKGTVKNYNVERHGPTQCKVTVQYDNDGSSRGPQLPDDQDPIYKDINVTYTRDTEKIPAFVLFHDTIGLGLDPDGRPNGSGPYQRRERWEPYDFLVDAYYATAEVTINLPSMNAGTQRDIAQQVNVIHKFPDGLQWQFIGATTTRQQESQWQITYRWIHDPGQPASGLNQIILPDDTDVPRDASEGTLTAGSLLLPIVARPSFAKWRVIPSSEDDPRPDIKAISPEKFRVVDDTGYQSLPGNPIP